ncbi:MAG: 1-acyl-sn-glycerol-3-phosphate acyltransferase [Muribaculaceae bacterium]|nr:acyltransferase [Bacteroides sp.]MDE6222274.1 1-acyl-sn-glycerol-3-phosphate acyltransferase [Muribaculaceae bacterium]MDE6229885.1 1-acyl-sn-glycerol-3-phosphate acyltransferase [Muribaculaceae bacterium]
MLQWLSGKLLKLAHWSVRLSVPDFEKSIICVAPHTSNWDFILGELAITSVGRHAGFLMKKAWFFWPLGCFFRSIGGVAVGHEPGRSLTQQLIDKFNSAKRLNIAITPEGTRSLQPEWHTGFLRVAYATGVPVCLAAIDFKTRTIIMEKVFTPTGNIEADMRAVKDYFTPFEGKYPEKFTTR